MASTTKTVNLELSQFVGTDKPAWLTDYNGDMQKIDDGYKKLEDANTATQADLDATKQNLDGSKSDISDLEAEVQALTAADVALQTRATVLEANYDTMHHEVAVNAQDIADMKPYAMIAADKKGTIMFNALKAIGITGSEDHIRLGAFLSDEYQRIFTIGTIDSGEHYIDSSLFNNTNQTNTDFMNIVVPAGGIHFELISDEEVAIHFKSAGGNKFISIHCSKTNGISLYLNDNGSVTTLFNIPVPSAP